MRRATRGAACAAALLLQGLTAFAQPSSPPPAAPDPFWNVPDLGSLPDDEHGRLVRRGRDLITATYAHLGPNVPDPAKRYAGNNLACSNCHLDAGAKKFGNPLWGLKDRFPQYDAEAGRSISLEQRVNACMTRSMNGRPLPADAPEMRAMLAYIDFLSEGVKPGEILTGYGSGPLAELDRPADPARGAAVYRRTCAVCHGTDGAGLRRSLPATDLGYMVPPLWGPDSFNDGAGMNRLTTIAGFVHANMPNGTSYLFPRLSPEEAWDVAAFVVSQPRPRKADLDRDFPDLLEKPADTPYGPYADGFPREQHVYGPFGPIRAAIARLKAERSGAAPEGAPKAGQ
ncbi:c-type cytochrome [Microvirga thermotolerans]|uniref:C-type cytochrome n=1 Tax=Microvirga thermotolerans TaxID=2651334 RepID=A0A5P9JSH3_9HYPH|nr:c-type cytochrome [Microvirga thermotolerans]QFU15343.1 c-type cytochrome [Microvirga thermotolerans]